MHELSELVALEQKQQSNNGKKGIEATQPAFQTPRHTNHLHDLGELTQHSLKWPRVALPRGIRDRIREVNR